MDADTVTTAPNENDNATKTTATAALNLLVMGTPRERGARTRLAASIRAGFLGKQ